MMENESLKQILRKVQCSHCGYLAFQYDDELEEFMEKLKSVGTEKELNKTGTIGVSPVKQRELNSNDSVSSEISGLKRWTRIEIVKYPNISPIYSSIGMMEKFENESFLKTSDVEKVLDDEIKRWYPYTTEFRKGCLRSLKDLKKKLLGEGEKK